jgi:ribonuclease J
MVEREKENMKLRVVFLGGIEEIGKNMTLFEFENESILLDAGFKFPGVELLGIDKVIPDMTYLIDNIDKLKGIILSHGHADHIGAIRYFADKIKVPIYSSPLTLGILKEELPSYMVKALNFVEVKLPSTHTIGKTKVDFIRMTHSIPDGFSTVFHTPFGSIVESGDFKIDLTPIDNKPIDLQRLAQAGKQGVLLYMGDSTNADEDGFTGSEKTVGQKLEDLIRGTDQRVFVGTFSTNLHRLQQVFDIARKVNRKVLVDGKSIMQVIQVASKLKYFQVDQSQLITYVQAARIPDSEILILTTGTQGEPFSGLTRLARNNHDSLQTKKGDVVIISADPIPGNEAFVCQVIDNLLKRGAEVIYKREGVHVSGHGSKEDLRTMLSILKPKFFIPIHGEYRQMYAHTRIAQETGIPATNTVIVENGTIISLTKNQLTKVGKIPSEPVFIDGKMVGDVEYSVIDERKRLSREGVLNTVLLVNKKTRKLSSDPIIETKGLMSTKFSSELFQLAKKGIEEVVLKWSNQNGNASDLEKMVKGYLSSFISSEVRRNPIIFVTVLGA